MRGKQVHVKLALIMAGFLATGLVLGSILTGITWSSGAGVLSVGVIVGLAFGVGVWIVKGSLSPLREAQRVAAELAATYGAKEQAAKGDNELHELNRTLLQLSSHLRSRMQTLEGERAKVTTILDSMVEGVMALDAHGRILVTNPSARRILDFAPEQLESRSLLEVVRNRELADLVKWCQSLTTPERCSREVELTMPQRRVLEVNAMPLALADQQRGLVLVLHDITELRRLEQVRAEFVANVSHELRTPLTAIKGYLETLLDESSPDPLMYRHFLEVAHTHADRLGRLVNDLMKLSDIETGKITLKQESVSLVESVSEVVGIYQNKARKKGVTLTNQVPSDIIIKADRDRLSQILINLLDNAVKYTASSGEIRFSTRNGDRSDDVILSVQDTGQGIPPEDLPRITERFYRVDKARSREEGGIGLGLAIVKHLVHLHGGSIQIQSEFGKGTRVDIVLSLVQTVASR